MGMANKKSECGNLVLYALQDTFIVHTIEEIQVSTERTRRELERRLYLPLNQWKELRSMKTALGLQYVHNI